jgi:hypothetical protein
LRDEIPVFEAQGITANVTQMGSEARHIGLGRKRLGSMRMRVDMKKGPPYILFKKMFFV